MARVKGRRAFAVGAVISRTFSVWLRNIVPFTLLALIVEAPLFIYTAILLLGGMTPEKHKTWALVTNYGPLVLNPIVAGLIAYGVFQQLSGKAAGLGECLEKGLRHIVPVLLTGIVVALLIMLGFALLVIPGIIVACMLWVAVPAAVVERVGVFTALRRSNALTSGEKGNVFVVFLVLGLIGFVAGFVMGLLFVGSGNSVGFLWGMMVLKLVLNVLQSVAAAVGYHDLRISKEGASVEELVAVFA